MLYAILKRGALLPIAPVVCRLTMRAIAVWSKVRRITHDRQSEFDKTLAFWHEMFSNASDEPIQLVGEVIVVQKVVGSEFDVKTDADSAGIQAIDVILWL
jgi:hypothetical protein